ncbi:hypothetical protein Vadar_007260 [Vaccinium darrowii]|uniref:Uncharacterized protein n=1 Tax=Vaccinium darrowii TaxID=229202 RepID=A0ACB7X7W8_9ERIC|nr:hypothetical protein Vadar_007260 [Vaccinium darrowii]
MESRKLPKIRTWGYNIVYLQRGRHSTLIFLVVSYKEANPDCKSVSVVAKEGGVKWKSMANEVSYYEKIAYVDRAAELKGEYGKALNPDDDADNADMHSFMMDREGSLEQKRNWTDIDGAGSCSS